MPFSFIPCAGSRRPEARPAPTRVRAMEERIACEITFPRVIGYRYDLPSERLTAHFTDDSDYALSTPNSRPAPRMRRSSASAASTRSTI